MHVSPKEQSGIITFESPDLPVDQLCRGLRHANIITSVRGGRLRVSPHLYTNEEDAKRFADTVNEVVPHLTAMPGRETQLH